MKKFYFIRHGLTHLNVEGRFAGRFETPLTAIGHEQAKAAGEKLKQHTQTVDMIIVSPLSRAVETAKHVASAVGYPHDQIETSELFVERSFGALEGELTEEFFATNTHSDIDAVDNAESLEELHLRAHECLEYLYSLPHEIIVVVGHGSHGRALRRAIQGTPYSEEYKGDQRIGNAEIVELL